MTSRNQPMKIITNLAGIMLLSFVCSCTKDDTTTPSGSEYRHLRVVFHVIHGGQPVGTEPNVSAASIQNQLGLLNSNFKKQNIKIEFVLASRNPAGQSLNEPGIERIYHADSVQSSATFFQESWVFNSMWDPDQYINIWICKVGDGLGRGTMPYVPTNHHLDGLISTDYYLSNPANYVEGILLTPYHLSSSAGYSITHEMGHCFGLIHVFDNGCSGTDYCDDTYQYDKTSPEVNYTVTACDGNSVLKNNYMDYGPAQEVRFTMDQVSRIGYVLTYAYHRPKSDSPNGIKKITDSMNGSFNSPIRPALYDCD